MLTMIIISFFQSSSVVSTPTDRPNPFLKSLKKPKPTPVANSLSLIDKFALEKETKENRTVEVKNEKRDYFIKIIFLCYLKVGEKRKLSDSDKDKPEKQKEKQRKLDSFKFTKKAA